MRRLLAVAAVLIATVLMAGGCGGGGDDDNGSSSKRDKERKAAKGDFSSPKAAAETMLAAVKAGDRDTLMACFCKNTRRLFGEAEEIMKEMAELKPERDDRGPIDEMLREGKDAPAPEFGEEKIDGDKATIEVTPTGKDGKKGRKRDLALVKEAGEWKFVGPPISDKVIERLRRQLDAMKKAEKE